MGISNFPESLKELRHDHAEAKYRLMVKSISLKGINYWASDSIEQIMITNA